MATIITRVYKDEATANAVVADLKADPYHGQSSTIIAGSDALDERMSAAGIGEDAAAAYGPLVKQGNTLLVVEALLGQARNAIKIVDQHPSVEVELDQQNAYVPTTYTKDMSKLIMKDHPLMLTSRDQVASDGPFATRYGDFAVPLLSSRKPPENALIRGTKFFGGFVMSHLSSRTPPENAVIRGTKRFGAFLVPLLKSKGPRRNSAYSGTVRFGDFLAPLIIRR